MQFKCILQGSIAVAGGLVKWLRDNLGIIKESKDIGNFMIQSFQI